MGNNIIITITCLPPDGVDIPWFELSYEANDTVKWQNTSGKECTLDFKGGHPFPHSITIEPGQESPPFSARNGPAPSPDCPPGQIYRVYYYSVTCAKGCSFDPGGGMRP